MDELAIAERMAGTGVPYGFWNVSMDESSVLELVLASYGSGKDTIIYRGNPIKRVMRASWIAKEIRFRDNPFPRLNGEPKHHTSSSGGFTQPYTVRMMDVDELVDLHKLLSRDYDDVGDSFTDEVCSPDFFFLRELGSELANNFTSRIVVNLLSDRMDRSLPVVVTLARDVDDIEYKNRSVYGDVAIYLADAQKIRIQ